MRTSLNFLINISSSLHNPYPPESILNLTLIDTKSSSYFTWQRSPPQLTWYWYVLISEDTLTIVKPLALGLWIPSHETLERHSGSFSYNLNLLGRPDPGWFWNSNIDFNISCEPWVELWQFQSFSALLQLCRFYKEMVAIFKTTWVGKK